jgi:outer membrane cobalamin receptor
VHIAVATIEPRGKSEVLRIGRTRGVKSWLQWLVVFCVAVFFLETFPLQAQVRAADLTSLSLEDLMNTEVTSVSKTEQKISRTASAIFVITSVDIARSGATSIPDLLRMVPGVDVAQIDANTWAITARGLNGRYSNELLVLLDGRTVYTPTFGGVFWDVLDLPLENIDRIEVIRGPGGTIWGANAVNGVVNIITKRAAETRGGMVVAGGGNLNQGFGTTLDVGRDGDDVLLFGGRGAWPVRHRVSGEGGISLQFRQVRGMAGRRLCQR